MIIAFNLKKYTSTANIYKLILLVTGLYNIYTRSLLIDNKLIDHYCNFTEPHKVKLYEKFKKEILKIYYINCKENSTKENKKIPIIVL